MGSPCWLGGRRLPLAEVSFCQACPPNLAEYRLVFGNNLRFGEAASALAFDAKLLGLPVIRDAAAVRAFLRQAPANFLVKYRTQAGGVARIRGLLSERPLAEWPSFDDLASALQTTPSTLRRRLEREGSSFQVIKDDLRRDMAIDLLCNSSRSVDDIGFTLGFAEHSAFYRAFRRWTGASPGEYRGKVARAPG
jgi:AraC-like DNA-binding protein